MRTITIILLLFSTYAVFAQNAPVLVKDIGKPGDQAIFHGNIIGQMGEQYQIGQSQDILYLISENLVAIPFFYLDSSDELKMLASHQNRAFLFSPKGQFLRTDGTTDGTFWIENPDDIKVEEIRADMSNDTVVFAAAKNGVPNLYLYCDANLSPKQLTNWNITESVSLFKTVLLRGNYVLLAKNTNSTSGKQNLYTYNLHLGVLDELINNMSIAYTYQEWNKKPAFFTYNNNITNPYFELTATDGSPANTEKITIGSRLSYLSIVGNKLFWWDHNSDALFVSQDGQFIDTITCPPGVLLSTSLFYSHDQPFPHDSQNRLIIPFKHNNTFGFWLGNKETQTIWDIGNIKIFKILAVVNDRIFFSSMDNLGTFSLYAADSTGVRLVGDGTLKFFYKPNVLSTSKGLLTKNDNIALYPFPEWFVVNTSNLTTQRLKLRLPSSAVSGGPSSFFRLGENKLLFQADDGTEREQYKIWITDGTTAGTYADTFSYPTPPNYLNSMTTSGNYILNRLISNNSSSSFIVSHRDGQAKWDTILYSNNYTLNYKSIGDATYFYTTNAVWKTDGTVLGTVQLFTLPGAGMDINFFTGDANYLYFTVLDNTQLNKSIVQYNLSTGQQTTLETLPNSPNVRIFTTAKKTLFYYNIIEYSPVDTIRTLVVPGIARYTVKDPLILNYAIAYKGAIYGVNAYATNHICRYSNDEKTTFGDFHQIMHWEQRGNALMVIAQTKNKETIQLWKLDLDSQELTWIKDITEYVDNNGYLTFEDRSGNTFFVEYNLDDVETTIWHIGSNIDEVNPIAYFNGYIAFWEPNVIIALNNALFFWLYTPELGVELWKFTPDASPSPYLHHIAPIIITSNPSRGDVQAQMPPQITDFSEAELDIINSSGQTVRSFTANSPSVTIPRQGLAAGYYTVILRSPNGPIVGVGRFVWVD